jgi:hypothetical protein
LVSPNVDFQVRGFDRRRPANIRRTGLREEWTSCKA